MSWRAPVSQVVRGALVMGAVLAALAHAGGIWRMAFIDQIDLAIADARLRAHMPRSLDPRIVIVDIDEASLSTVGRWPWGRDRMAALADELFQRQNVAAVGLDLLFAEPDNSSGLSALEAMAATNTSLQPGLATMRATLDYDNRFARALTGRAAVLGFYLTRDRGGHRAGVLPAPVFDAAALRGRSVAFTHWDGFASNIPPIANAVPMGGFFNSLPDSDGVVRSVPLIAELDGHHHEALALALFRRYTGSPLVEPGFPRQDWLPRDYDGLERIVLAQGSQRVAIPVDARVGVRVPFRGAGGPHGGSFEYVSAGDLLSGRVAAGRLAGKLVLVGSTAPGLFDLRPTPVSEAFPGVEVHANLLSGLLDGRLPVQPDWSRGAEVLQIVLAAGAMALVLPRLGAASALGFTAGLAIVLVGLNLWLYQARGLVLPLASALLLVALVNAGTTVWGHITEGRTRRSLARLFGSYVPPELVTEMARDPARYDMRAENRVLSIMFCDMRNFTRVSEALSPEDLRALVNRFFSSMTAAIRDERGTLDKYIGDAIMAFWGAPVADAAHAEHAVRAALAMLERMKTLNQDLSARGLPQIGLGLGINTGLVCVGDMGSDIRRSYTVMGDAVNLASRIESLTRHYGLDLLVGQATRDAAGGTLTWLEVDHVKVKGKQQAVTLFTPVPVGLAAAPAFREEMRFWLLAQQSYRRQHWDEAQSAVSELRSRFAESPFSGLYQQFFERIIQYRRTPPPPDWDGTHTFDSK
jgi:adenylate cyclase